MNTAEALAEANRLSRLIDAAIDALKNTSVAFAEAEREYRRSKSRAWLECKALDMLAKEKEAWVDAESSDDRYRRDVAEGMRQAALEAVRSRRAQLSALQTFLNAERAEADFARTSPAGVG